MYITLMKYIEWDLGKNERLLKERGISFDMIVEHIQKGHVLDRVKHPNKGKYPNQWMYIIEINKYAYAVPFVERGENIFLKTIIPSRKFTKKYLR